MAKKDKKVEKVSETWAVGKGKPPTRIDSVKKAAKAVADGQDLLHVSKKVQMKTDRSKKKEN